jgi:hypothetical protein
MLGATTNVGDGTLLAWSVNVMGNPTVPDAVGDGVHVYVIPPAVNDRVPLVNPGLEAVMIPVPVDVGVKVNVPVDWPVLITNEAGEKKDGSSANPGREST